MHGLIFKIKESHRQDQSESFVFYIETCKIHKTSKKCVCIYAFCFTTTSQMKSLHYDQCLYVYIYRYIHSLFHRDETKPTHIIGINSFLFLMQLIYKHSSPNYQHMINYWKLINKMLVFFYLRKLKHFQPHSLLCQLWCMFFMRGNCSFLCDISIWLLEKLTKQLRQTFFFII